MYSRRSLKFFTFPPSPVNTIFIKSKSNTNKNSVGSTYKLETHSYETIFFRNPINKENIAQDRKNRDNINCVRLPVFYWLIASVLALLVWRSQRIDLLSKLKA